MAVAMDPDNPPLIASSCGTIIAAAINIGFISGHRESCGDRGKTMRPFRDLGRLLGLPLQGFELLERPVSLPPSRTVVVRLVGESITRAFSA